MTANHLPPQRQLPPDRLEQRKHHLLAEIAQEEERPVPQSPPKGRLALATAAVVVAAVAAVVVTRGGTDTASAAEVRAKLDEGLHVRQSLRGEISVRTQPAGPRPRGVHGCQNCAPVIPQPSKFVVGTDGSYSSLTLPLDAVNRHDIAYDASTGIETSFGTLANTYIRTLNLDPAAPTHDPQERLGTWAQGALGDSNPGVENVTFAGRPAWELTVRFTPGEWLYDTYGIRVDVVVDRATGLVLQVTQYAYSPDRWTSIEAVHDLEIGGPTSAADFTVPKPASAREIIHDFKFQRVPIRAAAAIVGYRPLVPTDSLGRELTDFAVAKTTNTVPIPGVVPSYRGVVSARYGSGVDPVTLDTPWPAGRAPTAPRGHELAPRPPHERRSRRRRGIRQHVAPECSFLRRLSSWPARPGLRALGNRRGQGRAVTSRGSLSVEISR